MNPSPSDEQARPRPLSISAASNKAELYLVDANQQKSALMFWPEATLRWINFSVISEARNRPKKKQQLMPKETKQKN